MQSFGMFVDSWATTSRLNINEVAIRPDFRSSARFPCREELRIELPPFKMREEKFVMDRFEFDVQRLRNEHQASRVILVSSVISTALLNSVERVKHCRLPSAFSVVHTMNLRRRTASPVAANYFGNMYTRTIIRSAVTETFGLGSMVALLQGGIRNAFGRYSEVTSDYDLCSTVVKETEELFREEGEHLIAFSSWCGFGIYKNDFGFGKPEAVTSTCVPFRLAILMDRQSGDGIDAWISLSETDMNLFKRDPNITAFGKF
ncbi:hypothetical protein MLD38_032387 [Melastoma candidum]|nr:hypothetical protein MLD38_032387 [Melastoma candidum]